MAISIANVYRGMGASYYARDNYYTRDTLIENSHWQGQGARSLELRGGVDPQKFQNLLDGKHPDNSEQWLGSKKVDRVYEHGIHRQRGGVDVTISPPKSLSICALIEGDTRVWDALRDANRDLMKKIERDYSLTRQQVDGEKIYSRMGLVIAQFEHTTTRAKDPGLHIHNVITGLGERESDGKWRSIDNNRIFKDSAKLDQYFEKRLEHHLNERGFETVRTEDGRLELAGYERVEILEFSRQSQKIKELHAPTKKQERSLKLQIRNPKDHSLSHVDLRQEWQSRLLDVRSSNALAYDPLYLLQKEDTMPRSKSYKTHEHDVIDKMRDFWNDIKEITVTAGKSNEPTATQEDLAKLAIERAEKSPLGLSFVTRQDVVQESEKALNQAERSLDKVTVEAELKAQPSPGDKEKLGELQAQKEQLQDKVEDLRSQGQVDLSQSRELKEQSVNLRKEFESVAEKNEKATMFNYAEIFKRYNEKSEQEKPNRQLEKDSERERDDD